MAFQGLLLQLEPGSAAPHEPPAGDRGERRRARVRGRGGEEGQRVGLDALERVRGRWGAVLRRRLFVFGYRGGMVIGLARTVGYRCWRAGPHGPARCDYRWDGCSCSGLFCMKVKVLTTVLRRFGCLCAFCGIEPSAGVGVMAGTQAGTRYHALRVRHRPKWAQPLRPL